MRWALACGTRVQAHASVVQVISGEMEESIFSIAIQTFHTLTELCQGPCPDNQAALVGCNLTSDINAVLESNFVDRYAHGQAPAAAPAREFARARTGVRGPAVCGSFGAE